MALRIVVLILMVLPVLNVKAQKPGNTSAAVEAWLKADAIEDGKTYSNGEGVTLWQNKSIGKLDFVKDATNAVPTFTDGGMNYHPALNFSGAGERLATTTTFTATGKSYLAFYVTSVDGLKTSCVIFAYRSQGADDIIYLSGDIWYKNLAYLAYQNYASSPSSGLITSNPGLAPKYYGIVSMKRAGGVGAMRHNGAYSATSVTASNITAAVNRAVIGNARVGAGNNYLPLNGKIQEIIILSASSGSVYTDAEMRRIQSYLAIKYGQTLDQSRQPDLYNSADAKIWETALHSGYTNDVFGIGRDDASGLYQKQSTNVEDKMMTVFLGDQLHKLNYDNEESFATDMTYLMFGSAGKTPVTYSQPVGTAYPLTGVTTTESMTHLIRKYKTQMTGPNSMTVGIASHLADPYDARYVLVSDDDNFVPTNTRAYLIVDGIAKNVLINTGDFVALAGALPTPSAPGNVTAGLRMWLNAENPATISISNDNVTSWKDQSGISNTVYTSHPANNYTNAPLYRKAEARTNYHPSVYFDNKASCGIYPAGCDYSWTRYLSTDHGPMSVANPGHYYFFTVLYHDFYKSGRTYFIGFGENYINGSNGDNGWKPTSHPGLGVIKADDGEIGGRYRQTNQQWNGTKDLFSRNTTLVGYYEVKKTEFVQYEFNGSAEKQTTNAGTIGNDVIQLNGEGTLGAANIIDRGMHGVIGEVIAYEGDLTLPEKDRIYSYLALKYGITLDKDKLNEGGTKYFDYFLSNNKHIWDGTSDPDHRKYHNNVAAVVRDDDAGLNNKQSHSTGSGTVVTMGIGERLGENPLLTGLDSNYEAIVWGDDGVDGTIPIGELPAELCGDITSRMKKIWRVDNLADKDYNVRIGAGGIEVPINDFPYNGSSNKVYLLISNNEDSIRDNNWQYTIPSVYIDGMHQFSYTFEKDSTYYFTFGGMVVAQACDGCTFDGNKQISFRSGAWPAGQRNRSFSMGDNFNVDISVTPTTGLIYSGYPAMSTNGSLKIKRNSSANVVTTKMVFSEAALASFKLWSITRYSGINDKVTVYGMCNGNIVRPTLSYVVAENRSSYKIDAASYTATAYRAAVYTSTAGQMQVSFDFPVKEIYIEFIGGRYSDQGIGAIDFRCPPPPPTINKYGLGFTKDVPAELRICEEVPYLFRMMNTNCDSKDFMFSDTLPPGMTWIPGSLILDDYNNSRMGEITITYNDSILTVTGLKAPGNSDFVFRAKGLFKDNALGDRNYDNRANIFYQFEGEDIVTVSCDAYHGCDSPTRVYVHDTPRLSPLQVTGPVLDKTCYKPGDTISVSFKVKNPNLTAPVQEVGLEVNYTDTFSYIKGSFVSDLSPQIGTPQFYIDEDPPYDTIQGIFFLDGSTTGTGTGFSIPANGEYEIKFKVKTRSTVVGSVNESNQPILTVDGVPIPIPFYTGFSFYSLSDDICQEAIYAYADGEIEINAAPPVTIATNPICKGSTVQLSRSAGGTWTSSDESIATVSAAGLVTAVDSGTVYFIFDDIATGCSATTPILRINAPKMAGGGTICVNATTQLSPSSGGTWMSRNTSIATISATGEVLGISAGNTYMRFTDGVHGCTDSIYIVVKDCLPATVPDIRLDVCPNPARDILLTSFIDTVPGTDVLWEKISVGAPGFTNITKGGIHSTDFMEGITYTYRYKFSIASVVQASALAYVHVLKTNGTHHKIDTIVVCRHQDINENINLSMLLGLELGGLWAFPEDPVGAISSNAIIFPVASRHYGTVKFNAIEAYLDATHAIHSINYHGDINAKKFKFQYTPATGSCLGTEPKTFVIVVTNIF